MSVDAEKEICQLPQFFKKLCWPSPWQTEHEDGGDDKDNVKGGEADQKAVDRALHLWPVRAKLWVNSKGSNIKQKVSAVGLNIERSVMFDTIQEQKMWAEGTLLKFLLTTSYCVFILPILK